MSEDQSMSHNFKKMIRVAEIRVEDVEYKRSTHYTTDYRRKVLCVHFDDGSWWVPKDTELEELKTKKREVKEHNYKFPDPDKEQE